MTDMINNPAHYAQASVQLEPIDVLRYAPFDLGNCLKYIIRAGHKGDALEDWMKAQKYLWWAMESYQYDKAPYEEFFKRYGVLLQKFEALMTFDAIDLSVMETFEFWDEMIRDEIKSLTNKNL